jgi:ribosomal protein S6E (S10)
MSSRTKAGTSVSLEFKFVDATGADKTGFDVTTLKLQFHRPGEAPSTATSLSLLGSSAAAFTAYGAREVDATNSPGVCRVDCPDGAFATGANEVSLTVTGASIKSVTRIVDLVNVDSRISTGKLPVTLAAADAGAFQIDQTQTVAAAPAAGTLGEVYYALQSFRLSQRGTAQGGTSSSITLDATASAIDNTYLGYAVKITGGLGVNQFATITAYNGTTKVATILRLGGTGTWTTTPDNTSVFIVEPVPMTNIVMLRGTLQTAGVIASPTNITSATGITVATNSDKNGYSLTQTFPTNFATSSIDSSGRVLLQPAQLGVVIPVVSAVTGLTVANLDVAVSSRSTLAAGAQMDLVNAPNATALTAAATAVWASTTRTLSAFTFTVAANLTQILGTALTETSGYLAAGFKSFFNVLSGTLTIGGTNQTGDNFPRIGAPTGASIAADIGTVLTAVQNVQNNTFIASSIPMTLQTPGSGSSTVSISFVFSDDTGAAKNLDSGNPVVVLVNDAGTNLSSRLGAWSNPATGKYTIPYTSTSTDATEGLNWDVTGTINSKLRRLPAYTQIVDTLAVNFTSSDRTTLNAINAKTVNLPALPASTSNITAAVGITVATNNDKTGYALTAAYDPAKTAAQAATALNTTDWTTARAGKLDNLDAAVTSRSSPTNITAGTLTNVSGAVGSVTSPVQTDMTQAVPTTPAAGTTGEVQYALRAFRLSQRGTAQGGTSSTITLDATASAIDNTYLGYAIKITGGTGANQFATITTYNGTTKVATIVRLDGTGTWGTTPDNTSVFIIEPVPMTNIAMLRGTLQTAGTIAQQSDVTTVGTSVASNNTLATAIKAKTDNLPTVPASQSDVTSAVTSVTAVGANVLTIKNEVEALQAELARVELATGSISGLVRVDHNYGTTDNLRYLNHLGSPISGAQILVFTQDAYQRRTETTPPDSWAIGSASTLPDGRWSNAVLLPAGLYVVQMRLDSLYSPTVTPIVVGVPDGVDGSVWNV